MIHFIIISFLVWENYHTIQKIKIKFSIDTYDFF